MKNNTSTNPPDVGGSNPITTAHAAPPSAVQASQPRLLARASAMAPTTGDNSAAHNVESAMPQANTAAPNLPACTSTPIQPAALCNKADVDESLPTTTFLMYSIKTVI